MKHAHLIRQPGSVICVSNTDDSALGGVDRALDRLRVAMKRAVGPMVAGTVLGCPDPSHLLVVHAVEQGPPGEHDEVTVGMVAGRIGVDPSRASRLVAAAIRSGLVLRVASQEDGRRSRLELTELGQKTADHSRQVRRELVARAMAGWDDAERAEFAQLLERFADGLCAAFGQAPPEQTPPE